MFKPHHLSHSSIQKYLDCPQKYAFEYVDGIEVRQDSPALIFGKAFHEGLAEHYRGNDWRKPMMVYAWKQVLAGLISRDDYNTMVRAGDAMMADFGVYGRKYQAKFVEQEFLVQLQNPLTQERLPVPIKGFIDLVTISEDVVDHKTTSASLVTNATVREQYEFQLSIYSMAVQTKFKLKPKRITIQSFLKRLTAGKTEYIDMEQDDVKEAMYWGKIKTVTERIMGEDFRATPGYSVCSRCPFNKICPSRAKD